MGALASETGVNVVKRMTWSEDLSSQLCLLFIRFDWSIKMYFKITECNAKICLISDQKVW